MLVYITMFSKIPVHYHRTLEGAKRAIEKKKERHSIQSHDTSRRIDFQNPLWLAIDRESRVIAVSHTIRDLTDDLLESRVRRVILISPHR